MPIDLYCSISSPPCRSVQMVGKALGVEFNLIKTSVLNEENKTPEFLKINPQHCIPTIVDKGFSLWESRAIMGYLVDQYGKDDSLYPKDPKKRAVVNQRMYFDIGTLFPRLRPYLMAVRKGEAPDSDTITKLEEALQLLDKFLEEQNWVAGSNITIADYTLATTMSFLDLVNYDYSKYHNIVKWLSKAEKTIVGYEEIQTAGNAELKKMMAAHSTHK